MIRLSTIAWSFSIASLLKSGMKGFVYASLELALFVFVAALVSMYLQKWERGL